MEYVILFLIGLVASILGALAGGGGLLTLPSMLMLGVPIQTGIAVNKFSTGLSCISSIPYLIKRTDMTKKEMFFSFILALLGGIAGSEVTAHISEKTMKIAAFFLLLFALSILIGSKKMMNVAEKATQKGGKIKNSIPFLIGTYDGGFGPGGATFAIIHFLSKGYDYAKSAQAARALILGSAVGGSIVFQSTGHMDWKVAIPMSLSSIIGTQIGMMLLPKVPRKVARTLLIAVTSVLILQVGWSII